MKLLGKMHFIQLQTERNHSMPNENTPAPAGEKNTGSKLTLLFIAAYIAHGMATQFGLIDQPIKYFMMEHLNLTPAQVSGYLAILMLPWVLKPFYGLLCDFVPLFGYRRKSYLIAVNVATALAFVVMAFSSTLPVILCCLLIIAIGMAASTAITVGLAVEGGRGEETGARNYFALQTMFYYGALVVASLLGGVLCHRLTALVAVHTAACIAAVPVFCVTMLTPFLLREHKTELNRTELNATLSGLKQVLRTRAFWVIALFVFCWDFSPSFGVPLYFWESKKLGFEQDVIGQLAAWNAGGMVIGSVVYRFLLKNKSIIWQLYFAIAFGALSTLGYLLLSTPTSAIVLELLRGCSTMLCILGIYALSSEVCAPRTEVTVMATMLAVRNLATDGSTFIGGLLFTHLFHNQLAPLIIVAASTTALCALLVPLLKRTK